jgi:mono/diheme cytochrome c family protein
MSDLSASAAAALGIPEAIVMRSAAARATETGMSVDDVLSAWAGGEEVAGAPPATAPVTAPPSAGEAPTGPPAEQGDIPSPPTPVVETPPAAALPSPAPVGPTTVSGRPPILVGKTDNPVAVFVGAVVLFAAVFLVGLVGPALPIDDPGARSSELPYSEAAVDGRHIFQSVGCASCHTQLIRPVVADVGLGAVTLNDSNQVLGTRRFGPDLSDVGSRLSASQIEATVNGLGSHPSLSLSQDDLAALVAYLIESKTSIVPPAAPPTTDDATTETTLGDEGS